MPPDQHHPQEVPMFDVVMGAVVPTLSTLAHPRRGECTAECADCGAGWVVPTAAGVPPMIRHEPWCPLS